MISQPNTRPIVRPIITPTRCTGCGWCVAACPDHLLVLELHERKKSAELALPQLCTGCAKCIPVCNFSAIKMVRQRGIVEGSRQADAVGRPSGLLPVSRLSN